MAKKTLLLIDGNNYLYRGAFATPPLTSRSGQPTNAIKGFMNILLADIYKVRPSHLVVTFDKGGRRNWRKKIYPEYKANRELQPGEEPNQVIVDAMAQFPTLRKLLRSIGIRTSGIRGHEADDIIGTLATMFELKGYRVIISSKDKDFAQLVNENVNMMVAESRTFLDADGIKEKFGVYPHQIIDYLALLGDGADNIPGVFKCGPKTAAKLLAEHKTLKRVIRNKHTMTPALLKNFEAVEHMFPLTKQLLKIKTDIRLKTTIANSRFPNEIVDEDLFLEICHELNLKQTAKQIQRLFKGS